MLWTGGSWITTAEAVEGSSAFVQGECGQAVNESVTLTQDIGPCPGPALQVYGDHVTIDGDGFKVIGTGPGIGVLIATPVVGQPDVVPPPSGIVIKRLFIRGFETGIATDGVGGLITESDLRSNGTAISLAGSNSVTNTIIDGNNIAISLVSPSQAIYHNLILGNGTQIEGTTDGSTWQGEADGYGNYWGDYWGVDDGSDGRVAGDFVGDTRLPHQGVDWAPLLDPSIPQAYGALICGDFWGPTYWLVWRGGWSPAALQVSDPFGRRLSRSLNEMGTGGFYAETDTVVPGHTLAQMIVTPCTNKGSVNGDYTLAMRALADLDYNLTWFASRAGERIVSDSVVGREMVAGSSQTVTMQLEQTTGPQGEWISGTVTSTGPTPVSVNTITFGPAPSGVTVGATGFSVSATATSDLPVTYSAKASGICAVGATTGALTPLAAGTCTIAADQAGNGIWDAASQVTQDFTVGTATSTVTVTCTAGAPYTYTGSAQKPCTALATGAGMSPVDVSSSLIYANNTSAGAATASGSWGGDANHTGSTGTGGFTIGPAATSVLYTGDQSVTVPNALKLAAQRTGPTACPISYALDTNPLTGVAGAYPLGQGGSVSTRNWLEGVYSLTVTLGGNANCLVSTDQTTLAVSTAGDAAVGGGWYTLTGAGRVNFGFTVKQVPKTNPTQYRGTLVLVNNGKWLISGTLTTYTKMGSTGTATGKGSLYWWNPALNGRRGGWSLAASKVTYTISFTPSNAKSTGSFGIQVSYLPVPPQPGSLPNSAPTVLKGGIVKMN